MRALATLPPSTARPAFDSREAIVTWSAETARQVLVGELAPSISAEARQLAALALRAHEVAVQERLADALLALERGGNAVVLLSRLTDGLATGRSRPLPGRSVTSLPAPAGEPA